MSQYCNKSENSSADVKKIQLSPLPLWKWLLFGMILLSIPVAALLQQAYETFKSTADLEKSHVATEVEKLATRIIVEVKTSIQLREVCKEYYFRWHSLNEQKHLLKEFIALASASLPFNGMLPFYLAENGFSLELAKLEAILREHIPGIKILRWGRNYEILAGSDSFVPKWAYQKLHESIVRRISRDESSEQHNRSYLDNVVLLQRYFGQHAPLAQFLKFGGETMNFSDPSGRNFWLYWENRRFNGLSPDKKQLEGFLIIVDLDLLPTTFALDMLQKRRGAEWAGAGLMVGWLDEVSGKSFLPYPFRAYEREEWKKWLGRKPDGHFEHKNISLAKRLGPDGLSIITAKSVLEIEQSFNRRLFLLSFFILLCLTAPLVMLARFRKNSGMAISIRWQIVALFTLSAVLPGAAIILLGSELLKDRQKTYENDAFTMLESLNRDFEKNTGFMFRFLEGKSDDLIRRLRTLDKNSSGNFNSLKEAEKHIREYASEIDFHHLYLLNSAGENVFNYSNRQNAKEGSGLLPLVQSLAKLKLRFSGHLRSSGKLGEISMMDLIVETTGGISHDDVRSILSTRQNRAFEMNFSGRRTFFFVGEFFLDSRPDEAHVLVILVRDVEYEKMFARLMIERFAESEKLGGKVQMFFGMNDFSRSNYFYPAPINSPWFKYLENTPDTVRLGRLSEPVRFSGMPVKETVELQESGKKCLFYGFRPASLEQISLFALFDYASISMELTRLRLFILVSLLVSMIVVYVLARIMARSLVEPVALLKSGVERIEEGNYLLELAMPGRDELVDLADSFNKMAHGLDQRERMTRYLSKSTVNAVVSGEDALMGGKKVAGTILFSDIRSFTTISETNPPETVVGLLNDYFAVMNAVVEKNGGDIDKFIGDAIMAQFLADVNSNEASADNAYSAVRCAVEMMRALREFNEKREAAGLFPIKIGVGINSGDVIAGNIGSPGRMDRTVIGDTVNVASRLEGMSKLGRHTCIIISRATLDLVHERVIVEKLAETAVKGKTSEVEMFEIVSIIPVG